MFAGLGDMGRFNHWRQSPPEAVGRAVDWPGAFQAAVRGSGGGLAFALEHHSKLADTAFDDFIAAFCASERQRSPSSVLSRQDHWRTGARSWKRSLSRAGGSRLLGIFKHELAVIKLFLSHGFFAAAIPPDAALAALHAARWQEHDPLARGGEASGGDWT